MRGIQPTFSVAKIEGDAVFGVAAVAELERQASSLLTGLRAVEDQFREVQQEQAAIASDHLCSECPVAGTLWLKMLLHRGVGVEVKGGAHTELHGPAVTLVHRLLKNSVAARIGPRPYLFLTDAAAAQLGLAERRRGACRTLSGRRRCDWTDRHAQLTRRVSQTALGDSISSSKSVRDADPGAARERLEVAFFYRCGHTTATTDWSRPAHVPPLGSVHLPLPPSHRRPRRPPRGRLRVSRRAGHRLAERRRLVRPEQRVGGGRRPSRGRTSGIGRLHRRGLPGRRRRGRALARVPGHDRDGARAARRRRPRRRHVRLRGDRR